MSSNVVNTVAYLRTSREYPEEMHGLCVEIDKTYVDVANAVNVRTIGIFATNKPSITGEGWFLKNAQKQQSLRQVYTFTSTADIDLGFKIASIDQFSRFFGIYTDGTSWYGLLGATSVAIAGQISFYVTVNAGNPKSDTIKFLVGAGAPALSSGKVVLEWLSVV